MSRSRRVATAACAGLTLSLLSGVSAAQARPLYDGYVRLIGNGKVHKSFQGSGWQTVFKERAASRVRYRVCLTHRPTKVRRCWTRTTGADGTSTVNVSLFVNDVGGPGSWRATFLVGKRRVASWDFTVLPEQDGSTLAPGPAMEPSSGHVT